jgi:Lipocalin-like domain
MNRILISAVSTALLLALGHAASAQDAASQIVGVWKAVDISVKEVESGKISKPYGERPTAYFIYTRGGRFSWTFVSQNRTKPAGAILTDAERIELFNTMSFGTGTYKVEGDKVVYKYDSSHHHAWAGVERSTQVPALTATTMVNTSAPIKHPVTGVELVSIQTFERVE